MRQALVLVRLAAVWTLGFAPMAVIAKIRKRLLNPHAWKHSVSFCLQRGYTFSTEGGM